MNLLWLVKMAVIAVFLATGLIVDNNSVMKVSRTSSVIVVSYFDTPIEVYKK